MSSTNLPDVANVGVIDRWWSKIHIPSSGKLSLLVVGLWTVPCKLKINYIQRCKELIFRCQGKEMYILRLRAKHFIREWIFPPSNEVTTSHLLNGTSPKLTYNIPNKCEWCFCNNVFVYSLIMEIKRKQLLLLQLFQEIDIVTQTLKKSNFFLYSAGSYIIKSKFLKNQWKPKKLVNICLYNLI